MSEWQKVFNPANGSLHEWEIWAGDEFIAACPDEADADAIIRDHADAQNWRSIYRLTISLIQNTKQ